MVMVEPVLPEVGENDVTVGGAAKTRKTKNEKNSVEISVFISTTGLSLFNWSRNVNSRFRKTNEVYRKKL